MGLPKIRLDPMPATYAKGFQLCMPLSRLKKTNCLLVLESCNRFLTHSQMRSRFPNSPQNAIVSVTNIDADAIQVYGGLFQLLGESNHPVIMEYVTDCFIQKLVTELCNDSGILSKPLRIN